MNLLYGPMAFVTILRKRGGGGVPPSPYQQWDNAPESPLLTEDFPYQVLVSDSDGTLKLYIATSILYKTSSTRIRNTNGDGNGRLNILTGNQWVHGGNTWMVDFTGSVLEANHDVYNDSSHSTVFFAKTTG